MTEPAVLVFGEALADLVPRDATSTVYDAVLGGSGFNTALALARFGARAGYCATLSSDAIGARFRDRLAGEGVDMRFCATSAAPTPLAVIAPMSHDGQAHYHFHIAATALDAPPPLPEGLQGFAHLHLTSFAATTGAAGDTALALAGRMRATGASVSYDVNIRPAALPPRDEAMRLVERRIAHCDLVKASREDLDWLFPGRAPEELAARWRSGGARLVIVTDGADGATCHGEQGAVPVPGRPVAVVDTIGAGDTFIAGMLAMLAARRRLGPGLTALARAELEAALEFAAGVAAETCTRPGCDPPHRSARSR